MQAPGGCGCCACSGRGLAGLEEPATVTAIAAAGLDRDAIGAFAGKVFQMARDSIVMAVAAVADEVGLFSLLAAAGKPLSAAELATAGGLSERYVLEICSCLSCAEWVEYDAAADTFSISPEHAKLLTDPIFPIGVGGWLQMVPALHRAVPGVAAATRAAETVTGVPMASFSEWGFTAGMDRMNTPGIIAGYVKKWLPMCPAAVAILEAGGAQVADLGTGCGAVAIALAAAFPACTVLGIDLDPYSIERAKAAAAPLGLSNLSFVCRDMAELAAGRFDLITNHDCIHDLKDPVGVLRVVRRALKPTTGLFFSSEPKSGENLAENLGPAMTVGYGISTMHCMTVSLAQGGLGLGFAFGPNKYASLAKEAGFDGFELVGDNGLNNFYQLSSTSAGASAGL
jgi:SAM-dependent methyltransferase